jgi:nondiscriminating aspartyl-tRNA synthetase
VERVWTTEIGQHIGERIRLAGWLHRFRQLSRVSFLVLRDVQGTAQVVLEDPQLIHQIRALHHESVLSIVGDVVAQPAALHGAELHNPQVEVLSAASAPPPIDLFRPELGVQLPTLLDYAAISLRHPVRRAIAQLSSAAVEGFRAALLARDFTEVNTPKIVASATESGANVFLLDYFGEQAYLAQSPQLYKQIMVGVLERVFEVGPVFRAEPHDTSRHLNQYQSLDVEMGFIRDHRDVMALLTEVLREMIATLHTRTAEQLRQLHVALPTIGVQIPVIHFRAAQALISHATGEDLRDEPDLAPAHEQWLGQWALREYGSEFLFVEGYPMSKRPFYTHPSPTDPEHSNSFDLLFRGLELVTGGQRLHRYQDYLQAMGARGLPTEAFSGYLQAFRHGMPPHGGFAIGLERFIARLVGASNVREVALFPRDMHRLQP